MDIFSDCPASQVKPNSGPGASAYGVSDPLSLNCDTLSSEGLASKYDMPMLAALALERLQRRLECFLRTNWDHKDPSNPDLQEEVTNEYWQIVERAIHWKHQGNLDACMDIIARPLQSRSKRDEQIGSQACLCLQTGQEA